MICTFTTNDDGIPVVFCGRRRPRPKCKCGAPATKECDFIIEERHARDATCDKPLCDRCAVSGGSNIDFCPDHPAQPGTQGKLEL